MLKECNRGSLKRNESQISVGSDDSLHSSVSLLLIKSVTKVIWHLASLAVGGKVQKDSRLFNHLQTIGNHRTIYEIA
jgi:hypothetical protein